MYIYSVLNRIIDKQILPETICGELLFNDTNKRDSPKMFIKNNNIKPTCAANKSRKNKSRKS